LSFIREIQAAKPVADQIHESPLAITGPLAFLAVGSIFLGYMTKDIFVGVGTPFLDHSILILPQRNAMYLAEFLPFTIKNLPLFLGLFSLAAILLMYSLIRKYSLVYNPILNQIQWFLSYK